MTPVHDWSEFTVVRANPRDFEALTALRDDTARRLAAKGIDMGEFPVAAGEGTVSENVFVLLHGKEVAGTVTVLWTDSVLWGEQPVAAGYIHNLVIARSFAGQGLGRRLLQWAEDHISASGRSVARVDCVVENTELRHLYEAVGFHWVRDEDSSVVAPARTKSLYEKTLRAVP
jgi:ribosomal protein S18 acetylase RimI-like enzyme